MAVTLISAANLIAELRVQISDIEAKAAAFRFRVTDTAVTRALLTITTTKFQTTITGGSTANLNIDLVTGSPAVPITILQLVQQIQSVGGYEVDLDTNGEWLHAANDLRLTPSNGISIGQTDYLVQNHAFSDAELTLIINRAARDHNPAYSSSTTPEAEAGLVLLLAHASVIRILMSDTAKFYAIEGTLSAVDKGQRTAQYATVLQLLEDTYERRVKRLGVKPDLDPDGESESGVVVVGQIRRSNYRYHVRTPLSGNIGPKSPDNFVASTTHGAVVDPETEVVLTWDRIHETNFNHVVIVRQTADDAKLLDNLRLALDTFSGDDDFDVVVTLYDPAQYWYKDEGLVSGTDYSYRLYVVDRNGEWAASAVQTVTTD